MLVDDAGVLLGRSVLAAPLPRIESELDTNPFGLIRLAGAFTAVLAEPPDGPCANLQTRGRPSDLRRGVCLMGRGLWLSCNP